MTDVFETTQIVLNSYNIFLNRSKLRGIKPSEIKKQEEATPSGPVVEVLINICIDEEVLVLNLSL
jgi:hypothetical protein